jgi:hypothetical protein
MTSNLQAPGAAKETPKTDSSSLCRRFPGPSADSLRTVETCYLVGLALGPWAVLSGPQLE